MSQINDIQPEQFSATELDVYKYIIDTARIGSATSDTEPKEEEQFDHIFKHGSQSRACLSAAAIYARSFLPPLNEHIRTLRSRLLELPEKFGKLTAEQWRARGIKNLKDGWQDERFFLRDIDAEVGVTEIRNKIIVCIKDRQERFSEINMLKGELVHRLDESLRQDWMEVFAVGGSKVKLWRRASTG